MKKEELVELIIEVIEEQMLDEEGKKDACYHKVKSRYKVWPSAYASGALVKCRKVGAKNWGNKSEGLYEEEGVTEKGLEQVLKDEGGAAGMGAFTDKFGKDKEKEIKDMLAKMSNVGQHKDKDYILQDDDEIKIVKQENKKKAGTESSKESSLRDWCGRKGAKGSKSGWVDCNAPDGKGGYKACGRGSGEKRKKYPACRPTPGACKERGKGKSWGKKAKKNEGFLYEGDDSILEMFQGATLDDGQLVCEACLFEVLQEASCGCPDLMGEAEYRGRKVTLNKPMRGDVKKFKVYVKDPKTGNVKKVNFGDPNMRIKKSNPKRRKSFRARHNCDNPGPKTKARYWSCKKW